MKHVFYYHLKIGTKTLVQLYKELSCLRNEPSLSWGDVKFNQTDHQIVSFVREATGFEGFLVAANTGKEAQTVDFDIKHKIPSVISNFENASGLMLLDMQSFFGLT